MFEGSRHELFRDKDQEVAKQIVLDWLNDHCTASSSAVPKL